LGEVTAAMSRMDDLELDESVREKSMTLEQAAEYRSQTSAAKAKVLQKFGASFAQTFPNYLAMKRRTEQQRQRAEVMRSNVVAEALKPALRARAGAERRPVPIDVKVAMIPRDDLMPQAYVSLHSRAAEELTQLTVLVQLQTTGGWRYTTIYVPKLPTAGCGRFEPILLSSAFLNDVANAGANQVAKALELKQVKFSIWCGQFRAEEQNATLIKAEEMIDDYRLQAVGTGTIIDSRGGMAINAGAGGGNVAPPTAPAVPPRGRGPGVARPSAPLAKVEEEAHRRFEIIFKELATLKQGYEVVAELIDHRVGGAGSLRLRGQFQLPPVKRQAERRRTGGATAPDGTME